MLGLRAYTEIQFYEVSDRFDTELNSIISNGYAVMYGSAASFVEKSNKDGYLVGKAEVRRFFIQPMAGITEVNRLSHIIYVRIAII